VKGENQDYSQVLDWEEKPSGFDARRGIEQHTLVE